MSETILHALKTATDQVRYPDRLGNWPISKRIKDELTMTAYAAKLAESGTEAHLETYKAAAEAVASLGIRLPNPIEELEKTRRRSGVIL